MRSPITPELRQAVYRRDGWICQYCGTTTAPLYHLDHVVPVALGGQTALDNLVVACSVCNLHKKATVLVPNNLDTLTALNPDHRARILALAQQGKVHKERGIACHVFFTLDEMMRAQNVTAQALHKATGLAASTISELRTNKAKRFDVDTMLTLCKYFGCDVHQLITYDPSRTRFI